MAVAAASIVIITSANSDAARLLDFYELTVSANGGSLVIKYENIDQVPAICRLLVAADIDILHLTLV